MHDIYWFAAYLLTFSLFLGIGAFLKHSYFAFVARRMKGELVYLFWRLFTLAFLFVITFFSLTRFDIEKSLFQSMLSVILLPSALFALITDLITTPEHKNNYAYYLVSRNKRKRHHSSSVSEKEKR